MAPDVKPDGTAQSGQENEGGLSGAAVKIAFHKAQDQKATYADGEHRRLGGYLLLMAAYGAGVLGLSGLGPVYEVRSVLLVLLCLFNRSWPAGGPWPAWL